MNYLIAENDIDKYLKAIEMNPDNIKEQEEKKAKWLAEQMPKWEESLRTMRSIVPPNVFTASLAELKSSALPPKVKMNHSSKE